jgi:hypothetical protein
LIARKRFAALADWSRVCLGLRRGAGVRCDECSAGHDVGTRPRWRRFGSVVVRTAAVEGAGTPDIGSISRRGANSRRRYPLIGKKIIGHRAWRLGSQFAPADPNIATGQNLVLLQQKSGHHGGRAFLQPDVEQLHDLFPDICGVTQPRQLETLQRDARRRQQKIPRRLRFHTIIQGASPGPVYVTSVLLGVKGIP